MPSWCHRWSYSSSMPIASHNFWLRTWLLGPFHNSRKSKIFSACLCFALHIPHKRVHVTAFFASLRAAFVWAWRGQWSWLNFCTAVNLPKHGPSSLLWSSLHCFAVGMRNYNKTAFRRTSLKSTAVVPPKFKRGLYVCRHKKSSREHCSGKRLRPQRILI